MDIAAWKQKAKRIRQEIYALWLAMADRRVPWYAKALAFAVIAYAVSPIDLIPDFIPVLGYLDDLILIPAGIALVIKLVPRDVLADCRARATDERIPAGFGWIAAAVIVLIWAVLAWAIYTLIAG